MYSNSLTCYLSKSKKLISLFLSSILFCIFIIQKKFYVLNFIKLINIMKTNFDFRPSSYFSFFMIHIDVIMWYDYIVIFSIFIINLLHNLLYRSQWTHIIESIRWESRETIANREISKQSKITFCNCFPWYSAYQFYYLSPLEANSNNIIKTIYQNTV